MTDSEYLQKVLQLSKNGATYTDLIHAIIDDEISIEDAQPFIDELIASQLLVHNLEPSIKNILENNQSTTDLNALLSSHIHMLLNRLIPANQLLHELLIYDFFFRYYKSVEMKKGKEKCHSETRLAIEFEINY